MNRILSCVLVASFLAGCHTTEAFAIRSPKVEVPAPCLQQCEKVKALAPEDTEAFLRCLAVCPDTVVTPDECRDLAVSPGVQCADQAVRHAAPGRTVWLVIGIVASVLVFGSIAVASTP